MSAIQYAVKLKCDYPGCESEGDAVSPENPPAGWLSMSALGPYSPEIRTPTGVALRDFCSLHADVPLSKLLQALRYEVAPS